MSKGIPTGRTYLGFALLWQAVFFVAWIACLVFFGAGYFATAMVVILLTAYGFFRHARSIGRRAKQGIRRPTPELRRWLLITSESRDATRSGSPY
jgi:1,4-dihydroxy-2-naphthoate octaprenyltransferase